MRAGVYPLNGITPLAHQRIPTRGPGNALDRLTSLVTEIWPQNERVLALSVAAPGPTNPENGIVYRAPNIGWENVPLAEILQQRFQTPVALGNDANMAALGEWRFGAGQGHDNLLYMTISTGIGGGVILNGKLLLGWRGLASELGHITVLPDGPLCSCGQRGHLEAVASGTGIASYIREQVTSGRPSSLSLLTAPSARDVARAAAEGDRLALEALERSGTFIGRALADYCHVFNPSIIVLGGGVSSAGAPLMEPLKKALFEAVISPEYTNNLTVTRASLGDDVGLLGALVQARIQFPSN